ncbi:MAG TPA: hypothetical protein VHD37_00975 [Candidatus Paceibacterota bacterium]|nr:hypothetical protein [Candidatus Paceibacterota bacterium]
MGKRLDAAGSLAARRAATAGAPAENASRSGSGDAGAQKESAGRLVSQPDEADSRAAPPVKSDWRRLASEAVSEWETTQDAGLTPFDKARLNNGIPDLDERFANILLAQVEERLGRGRDAEDVMEFILDLNEVEDPERRHAYKSFFGHTWHARKRKRQQEQDEAFNREFAPLDEDGIQQ